MFFKSLMPTKAALKERNKRESFGQISKTAHIWSTCQSSTKGQLKCLLSPIF